MRQFIIKAIEERCMNKLFKAFMMFIALLSPVAVLSSCDNFSNSDKFVTYRKDGIDSFIEIDEDELEILLSTEKNAVLFVGSKGCSSCSNAKPIFQEVIKENHLVIYYIEYKSFNNCIEKLNYENNFSAVNRTPTLVFVKEGNEFYREQYSNNFLIAEEIARILFDKIAPNGPFLANDIYRKTMVNDITGVEYLNDYYTIDYLATESLDTIIQENKVTVYYARSTCSDCQYFDKNFILEYLKSSSKKLYIFDTIEIREDEKLWTSFKATYQFDNYRSGRVPTIVTYKNGIKDSMIVYVNDEIVKNDDGKYEVIDSFYKDLIGLTGDSFLEVYEACASLQHPLIKDYLDNNL